MPRLPTAEGDIKELEPSRQRDMATLALAGYTFSRDDSGWWTVRSPRDVYVSSGYDLSARLARAVSHFKAGVD